MVEVVEVGSAVVVEVALGGAAADEPEVAEGGEIGQIYDTPGGGGPKASGEDIVTTGHEASIGLADGAFEGEIATDRASSSTIDGGPGEIIRTAGLGRSGNGEK